MKINFLLIFLLTSCFNLVLPAIGLLQLRKEKEKSLYTWLLGCTSLATGYVLIVCRTLELPTWITFELAQFFVMSGLMLLLYALRNNLGLQSRKATGIFIILLFVSVFSILFRLDLPNVRQVFAHSGYASLEFYLFMLARKISKQYESRAMILCQLGFFSSFIVDVSRGIAIILSLSSLNPLDLSWSSIMLTLSITITTFLINYGYFGFLIEKIISTKKNLQLETLAALHQLQIIKKREEFLAESLAERDRILEIASHTDRLSTLDLLSTNIAHELNQPLSAIFLNIISLEEELKQNGQHSDEINELIFDLKNDSERIKSIFNKLRSLSRQNTIEMELISINDVLTTCETLLRGQLKDNNIVLSINYIRPDLPVYADKVLLTQVLINIIMNAIQALSATNNQKRLIDISVKADNDYVNITIDDNGPGIENNIRKKLLTYPVTSKDQGMGVGLLLCQMILKRFNGEISIAERVETGSRICLLLPCNFVE